MSSNPIRYVNYNVKMSMRVILWSCAWLSHYPISVLVALAKSMILRYRQNVTLGWQNKSD